MSKGLKATRENLRVLHIASWYPSADSLLRVPFIKAHYDSLNSFCRQRLVHVEVAAGGSLEVQFRLGEEDTSALVIRGFRGPARFREALTLLLLIILRISLGFRRSWDVVVVHVAWPTLRFRKVFHCLFGRNVVLIEHWSAYSRDFFLDPKSRAHARMRSMFSREFPIVAVSKSLARDIVEFSQRSDLDVRVLPNVVDARFRPLHSSGPPTIFMAANWNSFRLPFLLLNNFRSLLIERPDTRLVIAGGGPKINEMRRFVAEKKWSNHVSFLGHVDRGRIARELRHATIFAHPTSFETFSVITAEALCCGVPAVVSNVGALPELVVPDISGLLVENTEAAWCHALLRALDPEKLWEREKISSNARARFSPDSVGRQLSDILFEVATR